jgi:general secretion pathway protein G
MPTLDRDVPSPDRGGAHRPSRKGGSAMGIARRIRRWVRARRSQRGLTLIELLIVLAVIGILASIGLLLYANFTEQARIARAVADIANLSSEILTFEATNERLPNTLTEIGRAALLDPWGRPYEYLNFSLGALGQQRKDLALVPINTDFDLYSKGKDGLTQPPLTASTSRDDVVRASDGQYIGLASGY